MNVSIMNYYIDKRIVKSKGKLTWFSDQTNCMYNICNQKLDICTWVNTEIRPDSFCFPSSIEYNNVFHTTNANCCLCDTKELIFKFLMRFYY